MTLERVFVYGTLKAGGEFHGALSGARFLGARSLTGFRLYDTGFGYPAAVAGPGILHGEVYEVPEATLGILDAVEGAPDLFRRIDVDGLWVYVWAGPIQEETFRPIPRGAWDLPR